MVVTDVDRADSDVTTEPARKRREFRLPVLSRVSIQSKLLVMLLVTSVLSAAVVGFIGYPVGPHFAAGIGVRPADRDPRIADRQLQAKFTDLRIR